MPKMQHTTTKPILQKKPTHTKKLDQHQNQILHKMQRDKKMKNNAERQKQYREQHPDRIKESRKKYRGSEKGKQTEKAYAEKYRLSGKSKERAKRYFEKHKSNPEFKKRKRESARKSYRKNREHILPKQRIRGHERHLKIKYYCMEHYCNGKPRCQLCGITDIDVLTMDHTYGGGNRLRDEYGEKTGQNLYNRLIKENFPKGYRVLCFNCNHKESLRLKLRGKKVSDGTIKKYLLERK